MCLRPIVFLVAPRALVLLDDAAVVHRRWKSRRPVRSGCGRPSGAGRAIRLARRRGSARCLRSAREILGGLCVDARRRRDRCRPAARSRARHAQKAQRVAVGQRACLVCADNDVVGNSRDASGIGCVRTQRTKRVKRRHGAQIIWQRAAEGPMARARRHGRGDAPDANQRLEREPEHVAEPPGDEGDPACFDSPASWRSAYRRLRLTDAAASACRRRGAHRVCDARGGFVVAIALGDEAAFRRGDERDRFRGRLVWNTRLQGSKRVGRGGRGRARRSRSSSLSWSRCARLVHELAGADQHQPCRNTCCCGGERPASLRWRWRGDHVDCCRLCVLQVSPLVEANVGIAQLASKCGCRGRAPAAIDNGHGRQVRWDALRACQRASSHEGRAVPTFVPSQVAREVVDRVEWRHVDVEKRSVPCV